MKFIDFTVGLNYKTYHSNSDSVKSQIKSLLEVNHVIVVAEDEWTPYHDKYSFHIVADDDYFTLSFVGVYQSYDSEEVINLINIILERIQKDDSLLFIGETKFVPEEEGLRNYITRSEENEINKLITI